MFILPGSFVNNITILSNFKINKALLFILLWRQKLSYVRGMSKLGSFANK